MVWKNNPDHTPNIISGNMGGTGSTSRRERFAASEEELNFHPTHFTTACM
jgi:hypothetical protein